MITTESRRGGGRKPENRKARRRDEKGMRSGRMSGEGKRKNGLVIQNRETRRIEKRRAEILKSAEIALEEYKKGLTSKGTVADLLKELEEV